MTPAEPDMTAISDAGIGGDFRLDSVAHSDGAWAFVIKCVLESTFSGYATITTGHEGRGLALWMRGSMMLMDSPVIDPDFTIPPGASKQDAGFEFCRRLLELGFTGCRNQANETVASRPDELSVTQFSESGIVGRYKP